MYFHYASNLFSIVFISTTDLTKISIQRWVIEWNNLSNGGKNAYNYNPVCKIQLSFTIIDTCINSRMTGKEKSRAVQIHYWQCYTALQAGVTSSRAKHPFLEKLHLACVLPIPNNLQPKRLLIAYSSDPVYWWRKWGWVFFFLKSLL